MWNAVTRLRQVQALSQFGDLPANVDLIVMRQLKMSAAKAAVIAAKATTAGAPLSRHIAAPSSTLSAPVSIVPAPSIPPASWPSLLQQFQAALTPQSVASVTYYRDVAFAAAVCSELSDSDAAEEALADAAHYAAASKQLRNIVAGQGSPTSAELLASLLAQVKHAAPQIEAAKDAAKTAKDYSKAAELQELRWGALHDFAQQIHLIFSPLFAAGLHCLLWQLKPKR